MSRVIERYQKKEKDLGPNRKKGYSLNHHDHMQQQQEYLPQEAQSIARKIELLEDSKRKLLGSGLETCSVEELKQIENQLEKSLTKIRAKKNQLFREQIEKLTEREKLLVAENKKLREQCGMEASLATTSTAEESVEDVETELFIWPPERRRPEKPTN